MEHAVRPAKPDDIDRLVELCEQGNHALESYREPFYATGPNHASQLREKITKALDAAEGVALVYESGSHIDALLLGRVVNAPPVYDPGGKVCLIDTLCVANSILWENVAPKLIHGADAQVKRLGGVLLCVECLTSDSKKKDLLLSLNFTVASDWWYRDTVLAPPATPFAGEIVRAVVQDIPAIVRLCEQSRMELQGYQPVFWKKAQDSAARQTPYLEFLIAEQAQTILVHKTAGNLNGVIAVDLRTQDPIYIHRSPSCFTDDFAVQTKETWGTTGTALLIRAVSECKSKGALFTQVVCPHGNEAKGNMLKKLGYRVGHQWFVRSL